MIRLRTARSLAKLIREAESLDQAVEVLEGELRTRDVQSNALLRDLWEAAPCLMRAASLLEMGAYGDLGDTAVILRILAKEVRRRGA